MTVSIRALQPADSRNSFRSGNEDLDRFFRKYAADNQFALHLGVTYVAVESGRIAGFATVAPGTIQGEDFPSMRARKLPRYPLPVLRLARLAVHETHQRKGIGGMLLRYVFLRALEMAEHLGCVGVLVDAKPSAVGYYASFGFEAQPVIEGESAARPRPAAMFMDLETIRKAAGG